MARVPRVCWTCHGRCFGSAAVPCTGSRSLWRPSSGRSEKTGYTGEIRQIRISLEPWFLGPMEITHWLVHDILNYSSSALFNSSHTLCREGGLCITSHHASRRAVGLRNNHPKASDHHLPQIRLHFCLNRTVILMSPPVVRRCPTLLLCTYTRRLIYSHITVTVRRYSEPNTAR